jgi:putative transposase
MTIYPKLEHGLYYHIYNRGVNGETIFLEKRNYVHFLGLWARHIEPVADTFCFALLLNHLHFVSRMKTEQEQEAYWRQRQDESPIGQGRSFQPMAPSLAFRNMFIAYAKGMNKAYERTGALFERPFRRIVVDSESYFSHLVVYIHRNPQRHGLIVDFKGWSYTSYATILSDKKTHLRRDDVLAWFGGREAFKAVHAVGAEDVLPESLLLGDWQ